MPDPTGLIQLRFTSVFLIVPVLIPQRSEVHFAFIRQNGVGIDFLRTLSNVNIKPSGRHG